MAKLTYIPPTAAIFSVRVESGFAGSYRTIVCGCENMSDNGYVNYGSYSNDNGSMMEGINDGGTIFF